MSQQDTPTVLIHPPHTSSPGNGIHAATHSGKTSSAEQERVIQACLDSDCFKAELHYAERSGHHKIELVARLYKKLDRDEARDEQLVRVVFPAAPQLIELGSVLAVTCLYDLDKGYNIYGHVICAGPGVNGLLKAIHAPMGSAHPQPGVAGERAIMHFVDWKRAEWDRFLIDELDRGRQAASDTYIQNFWKAMDRMFGGGYLLNCPDTYHWRS